ncbi:hypothetical protein D918_02391 [Trichuris suis]|nr:hypothetical protein D918_02391 [Trichuris suis]
MSLLYLYFEANSAMPRCISQRNREKFSHQGYMYTIAAFDCIGTIKFWCCDMRYTYDCKAKLHTRAATNAVKKMINIHNQDADPARVEAAVVCATVQQRAEQTVENPAVIIDEAVQSTSTAVVGQMPSRAALRQRIQRRRGTIEAAPSQPLSRASIVLPDRYVMYSAHERFLLFDSGRHDEDRIRIFGREAYGA